MPHRSIRLPEGLDEDLEAEAEQLDLTVSEYLREILRDRDPPEQRTADTPDMEDVLDRLDALEARVDDVEGRLDEPTEEPTRRESPAPETGRDDESPTDTPKANSGRESAETSLPTDHDDVVEAILDGWDYGRTDRELEANRDLAAQALEWLRDYGDAAKKSDVPLDEFADADPLDRGTDSLWTELIRDQAWKRGIDQGYIEKTGRRTYEWVN